MQETPENVIIQALKENNKDVIMNFERDRKMGLFDKIKDTAKNWRDDAVKKLAYSEEDIAERKV